MRSHIERGSHLIQDGARLHSIQVERLKLTEEIYLTKEIKGLSDKENPFDDIHSLAKSLRKRMEGITEMIYRIE